MKLNTLKPQEGSTKAGKRIGRGQGSGRGGTSTKGHKGAQSRSGYKYRPWFEGGQMPLYRRIPKFGFKNRNRVEYTPINLDQLQKLADEKGVTEIDQQTFMDNGIVSKKGALVKILGRGELTASLKVSANKFSKSAKAAIEGAGGSAIEI